MGNRLKSLISVTIPEEMCSDMDKIIKRLNEAGMKINRSKFVETAIGLMLEQLFAEMDSAIKNAKNSKKEEC